MTEPLAGRTPTLQLLEVDLRGAYIRDSIMAHRYTRYLARAAESQRHAQRFHAVLVLLAITLGLWMLVQPRLFFGQQYAALSDCLKFAGGVFFPLLSGFPIREIYARKDKIDALTELSAELNSDEPVLVASAEAIVAKMLEKISGA